MRKFRLTRWQVLLGVALTVAWWGYVAFAYVSDAPYYVHAPERDPFFGSFVIPSTTDVYILAALWAIPAWLVYWLAVIAIGWSLRNNASARRVLVEIATFAVMIGVAYFVATLFPHEVKTHSWSGTSWMDATQSVPSATVFAATLISEAMIYVAFRILGSLNKAAHAEPIFAQEHSEAPSPASILGRLASLSPLSEDPPPSPAADWKMFRVEEAERRRAAILAKLGHGGI
jgi:hypothetical protein